MIDETQTPDAQPEGTGQESSMGGAGDWSTVPSSQPPSAPAQSLEPLPPPPLEPLPPTSQSGQPAGPPQSPTPGYQQVYGSQPQSPPPSGYAGAPGGGYPSPPSPPPGYSSGPQYPPPPPPAAGQGLSSTAAAAISYITFIPAVLFLVMEPYNRDRFVRFHAWQSIALWIVWAAIKIIFAIFAFAGIHLLLFGLWTLIIMILWLILFIFGLVALIKASQGQWYKIPIVGDIAVSLAGAQQ